VTRAPRYALFAVLTALAGVAVLPLPARAGNDGVVPKHDQPRRGPTAAAIDEQIGAQVQLDLIFRDENDQGIPLGDAIGGKPTILVPVYYRCPMLCTEILNELLEALREMPANFTAGNQFNIITLSMDPLEHGDLGRLKKKAYLDAYGRPGAEHGWRFLTGQKPNIEALLNTVGYRFEFDKMMKEYNHPSGLIILSPEGKVTRYFHGLNYRGAFKMNAPEVQGADGKYTRPTTTLRLSLIEAADGKGGSLMDQITLLCYRYDRLHQGYSLNVLRAVQIAGLVTLFFVALGALLAVRREGILGPVLRRIATFVLIFGAVSGLGAAGFVARKGNTNLAGALFAVSLLIIVVVSVIAYRRGLLLRVEPPSPAGQGGHGPTNALPPGGIA
jgi:protein SCO1